MKLSSVIKAFGYLCLLLADGFPVLEDECPKIIGSRHVQIKANPGEQLVLHCEAITNSEEDLTVIYWLVNGSFPEETTSSDRIIESEESSLEGGAILQRNLLLKNVTSEDLSSNFTCVVTNSAGTAQKIITLTSTTSRDCRGKKKRKH